MEDRTFFSGDLAAECRDSSAVPALTGLDVAYFGVYDGHNGYYVAEFLQSKLHKALYEVLAATNPYAARPTTSSSPVSDNSWICSAFVDACTSCDREIIEIDFHRQKAGLHSGNLASEVFGGSYCCPAISL